MHIFLDERDKELIDGQIDELTNNVSELKDDLINLNEVVVSLKIDEEIATKDNIVGVETTLDGNHYNASANFSGIKGFTNGRHYKMVFVPITSGTFTFKTLLNGIWRETVKSSTVILENEKCVIDIPGTIDFSSANKRLCILNGGGYVVNANIYVYDVTNVNEDILKNIDFTTCENPVKYEYIKIPQIVIHNSLIAENILFGKNASFLGDSLTADGSGGLYIPIVKENLGLNATKNCGIGGTRVSGNGENSFWTDNRVNSLSLDSDCLFIMGGTNEAPYTTVQDSDFTIDNHDTNNFVGAYNVLISKVLYKYLKLSSGYYSDIDYSGVTQVEEAKPYFRIILITPPKRFDSLSNLQKVESFADYVIRIAEMWGIPVCDVNHQMNMNMINRASYWTHQTDPDWVHFDSNAHRELANIVIGKVKSLN